ncbi:sphingomyelin phosphodiesterase [Rostrohypoxylon terebratum]|nr:sphingomyelin phosphodiesterase [Rostrohypoxylon terebratum]
MRIPSLVFIAVLIRGAVGSLDPGGGSPQAVLRPDVGGSAPGDLGPDGVIASFGGEALRPVSCAVCEAILLPLKLVAEGGDAVFVAVATELCERLGIADDDVCAGAISLEGPVIAHALRGMRIGSKTSRLLCVALMGLCSYPEVEPHEISFPSPKPRTARPAPSGLKPLQVVHFSDVHVDPLYFAGTEANCSQPICCRINTPDDLSGHVPAGPYGEHTCDSPVSLEESMYAAINTIAPDAAFAIFTGDIVDHAVWLTSQDYNSRDIQNTYARMAKAGLHVYGTAGNHEVSPTNAFPFREGKGMEGTQWIYELLAKVWRKWIGTRGAETAKAFGAYSVRHPTHSGDGTGGLRVISVNTNLYYHQNYWMYTDPMEKDPSGQLDWLVRELDAAEKAGERVYVVGHMPMGNRDAFRDASNYFDQIVGRYEGDIAAMFFGHTHYDEFQISYADYGKRSHANALVTSYIAPSMTPTSGHPAFRVYDVDPVTFAVLDVTTYIANMSDREFSTSGPKWTKYYSAKETYGSLLEKELRIELGGGQELTPAFWHNVTEALEGNETAFEEYFERRSRRWRVGICRGECKKTEICKMRAGRAQDNCVLPTVAGVRLGGVAEMTDGRMVLEEEECGGSVIRDTLGSITVSADTLRAFKEVVAEKGALDDF